MLSCEKSVQLAAVLSEKWAGSQHGYTGTLKDNYTIDLDEPLPMDNSKVKITIEPFSVNERRGNVNSVV